MSSEQDQEYAAKLAFKRDLHQIREETHRKLREIIDAEINRIGQKQGFSETGSRAEQSVAEACNKEAWEHRTGDKGPFQMLRKDNCRNTELFNHLDNMLKTNKNNITLGDFHYWAGEVGFIFRRSKKADSKS